MDFEAKDIRRLTKAMQGAPKPIEKDGYVFWVPGYGFVHEGTDLEAARKRHKALDIFLADMEKG